MKKNIGKILLASVVALLFFGNSVYAVDVPVTANLTSATVTLTKTTDVAFGTIVGSGVGTVTINANGGATTTATVTGSYQAPTDAASGAIKVEGNSTDNITITYPLTVAVSLGGLGVGSILTISDIEAKSTTTPLAVDAGVDGVINVGGVLSLAGGETEQLYSGTYTITATY